MMALAMRKAERRCPYHRYIRMSVPWLYMPDGMSIPSLYTYVHTIAIYAFEGHLSGSLGKAYD